MIVVRRRNNKKSFMKNSHARRDVQTIRPSRCLGVAGCLGEHSSSDHALRHAWEPAVLALGSAARILGEKVADYGERCSCQERCSLGETLSVHTCRSDVGWLIPIYGGDAAQDGFALLPFHLLCLRIPLFPRCGQMEHRPWIELDRSRRMVSTGEG